MYVREISTGPQGEEMVYSVQGVSCPKAQASRSITDRAVLEAAGR